MKFKFAILLIFILTGCLLYANDTTRVRVIFDLNKYQLAGTEQEILDDIIPADTSIVLKSIHIYGFCDSTEIETKDFKLSYLRALEVKKYLVQIGIADSLIKTIAGKGKKKSMDPGQTFLHNRQAYIEIEYEAILEDTPVIIKSVRKKKNDGN